MYVILLGHASRLYRHGAALVPYKILPRVPTMPLPDSLDLFLAIVYVRGESAIAIIDPSSPHGLLGSAFVT